MILFLLEWLIVQYIGAWEHSINMQLCVLWVQCYWIVEKSEVLDVEQAVVWGYSCITIFSTIIIASHHANFPLQNHPWPNMLYTFIIIIYCWLLSYVHILPQLCPFNSTYHHVKSLFHWYYLPGSLMTVNTPVNRGWWDVFSTVRLLPHAA